MVMSGGCSDDEVDVFSHQDAMLELLRHRSWRETFFMIQEDVNWMNAGSLLP